MKNVRFLELHTDLFHAGRNFGKKLNPKLLSGMTLQWDDKEKRKEGNQSNHLCDSTLYAWREAYSYLHQTPATPLSAEACIDHMAKEMEAIIIQQLQEKQQQLQEWADWL